MTISKAFTRAILAPLGVAVLLGGAASARADWDGYRHGWHHEQGWNQGWRHFAPPPVYYYPPPVAYAPRPYYYAPQYYAPPRTYFYFGF